MYLSMEVFTAAGQRTDKDSLGTLPVKPKCIYKGKIHFSMIPSKGDKIKLEAKRSYVTVTDVVRVYESPGIWVYVDLVDVNDDYVDLG